MKQRRVSINSLAQAYQVIKEMNLDTDESDYDRKKIASTYSRFDRGLILIEACFCKPGI